MESTTSPPLTPIRQYMSPIDTTTSTSPPNSYREQLRRRNSSFSSNHDRSPATPVNRHRFSNASQLSAEFGTPGRDEGGEGLGNLADELDQLDNGEDYEEGETLGGLEDNEDIGKEEISRDSGIDVSYKDSKNRSPNSVRNFSKPFAADKPPDEEDEEVEKFPPELEDLISTIARMTSYTSTTEDPLVPRFIERLQDLGNQSGLEIAVQRLTTTTNSLTTNLTTQSKTLQTLAQSLFPVFAFSAPLDPAVIEQTLPEIEALLSANPQPDVVTVQKLQKLDRETSEVIQALSQLSDTLQMGKQMTNTAARHLRNTQTMVTDLRLEAEQAEVARHELSKSDWNGKIRDRWCASECKDIMSGFEERCNELRRSLEEAAVV